MRSKIVFELINESPGLSYNEIARKTNFSNGVISHYLNKLLQEGEIEKEGIKRGKYFTKNIPKEYREIIILLRNKTNNQIFKILMKNLDVNDYTQNEISKKVKKSGSTISVCLKILRKSNIVERIIASKNSKFTSDISYRISNRRLSSKYLMKYNL